jgi:hypothetical protein
MTDKTTILKAFNTHFFDFLNDIIGIIKENEDIIYAKSSFETVKRANPTAILKSWFSFVYLPYKDIIDSGNVDFICQKDFRNDIADFSNQEEILNSINKIREPIKNMNDVNKQHSMKYIQNLSKLSLAYNNL